MSKALQFVKSPVSILYNHNQHVSTLYTSNTATKSAVVLLLTCKHELNEYIGVLLLCEEQCGV